MEKIFALRRKIKSKFQNRELIFGGWVSYPEVSITETFTSTEIDFLAIDMEHTNISLDEAKKIIISCHSNRTPCFPRQVSHSNNFTKPLLEFGCDGMLFPMVNNLNELKKIINDFKYSPNGKRSYGVNRAQNYGFEFDKYITEWNDTSSLIIQIESKEGVDNLSDMLKNENVDGVMIGPYDLSGSYGYPGNLEHATVKNACKKVIEICKENNKSCGTQITDVSQKNICKKIEEGYNFIILSSDLFILWQWAEKINKTIKEIKIG